MAVEKKKIFRNRTQVLQVIYDESMNRVEIPPNGTVEGNEAHYLAKYGAVLAEVAPEKK